MISRPVPTRCSVCGNSCAPTTCEKDTTSSRTSTVAAGEGLAALILFGLISLVISGAAANSDPSQPEPLKDTGPFKWPPGKPLPSDLQIEEKRAARRRERDALEAAEGARWMEENRRLEIGMLVVFVLGLFFVLLTVAVARATEPGFVNARGAPTLRSGASVVSTASPTRPTVEPTTRMRGPER